MQQQQLSSPEASLPKEPQPKRRKIQLACNKCRNRKTRCDGHRPACVACLERGLAAVCSYEVSAVPSRRPDGQLEQQVVIVQGGSPSSADKCAGYITNGSPTSHRLVSDHGRGSVSSATAPSNADDNNRVDGLATIAAQQDANLYGESSTIAFVRHVMHEPPTQESWQDTAASPDLEAIRDRDESLLIYPRRQAADDYMNSFWEFVHPVFPILHKTSFMSKYAEIWAPEPPHRDPISTSKVDEVAFSACLNLTFALGCQFSSFVATDKRVAVAGEFYQRARKIFIYDVLDTSSLPVLQMLLLTGVYLQSTKHSERCWNTIGLAIRAAQTLGLHSESTTRSPVRQVTREIRRRVWHVCVTLDRLLAMTFGRPAMITRSWDTPVPLMIDDEFLQAEGEGRQPIEVPSRLGLFVFSSKLYDILDKILVTFYVPGPSPPTSADESVQKLLSNVLTYNRQLDVFQKSIPDYLRLPTKVEVTSPYMNVSKIQIQARILICRFLYTRVILLRPLLLLSTQSNLRPGADIPDLWKAATLDRDLASYACNLCVKTAQELVENLCSNLDTPYRISPWHTVYLSFAVAIVLIAAQRCPVIDLAAKEEALDHSLDKCKTILAYHEPQIHSAGQAIRVLDKLRSHIRNTDSRGNSRHGTSGASPLQSPCMPVGQPGMDLENFANIAPPSQEWWNEILSDRTGLNSETWYNQHLVNLEWLDIP